MTLSYGVPMADPEEGAVSQLGGRAVFWLGLEPSTCTHSDPTHGGPFPRYTPSLGFLLYLQS